MDNIASTVVSTRVRLARNLAGYPFPNRLRSRGQAAEIIRAVHAAAESLRPFKLYYMSEISPNVAEALCDDHLISRNLAANTRCGAALIDERSQEEDGKFSVMINEEDHLREQFICCGMSLSRAYRSLARFDDELSELLRFAFDPELGYLTACPTNLGTGMRASVMLFLPGLARLGKMERLAQEISRAGHTVRGVYGEGSEAEGYMYQVSNEVTLGVREDEIVSEVQRTALEIVNLESHARRTLRDENGTALKDECLRAYGILTNCARITYEEFIGRISAVKLGVALGYLCADSFERIDALIAAARPANIGLYSDALPEAEERDERRAELCARELSCVARAGR